MDSDDTLLSIFSGVVSGRYAQRTGIGIHAGRIRGINSKIRGGKYRVHRSYTFPQRFESTVRCCTQNGVRGGSITVHFPIWHPEKLKTLLFSKTTKEQKTTGLEN